MESKRVFLGLGSNVGVGPENLKLAVRLLEKKLSRNLCLSPVYRSEPVGFLDQPWFYNMALSFPAGPEGPCKLLQIQKEIEAEMGRVVTFQNGPRVIDIDLLFYKDWVFESCRLVVPHPRISERSFVLRPLIDLDPTLIHPRLKDSVLQIFQEKREILSACEKLDYSGD